MNELNSKLNDILNDTAEMYDIVLKILSKVGVFTAHPEHPYHGGIVATIIDLYSKQQGIILHCKTDTPHGMQALHVKVTINGISIKPTDSSGVRYTKEMSQEDLENEDFLNELKQVYSGNKNLSEFGTKAINFVSKHQ